MNLNDIGENSVALKQVWELAVSRVTVEVRSKEQVAAGAKQWLPCNPDRNMIDVARFEYRAAPRDIVTYTSCRIINGAIKYGPTVGTLSAYDEVCLEIADFFLLTKIRSNGTIDHFRVDRDGMRILDSRIFMKR